MSSSGPWLSDLKAEFTGMIQNNHKSKHRQDIDTLIDIQVLHNYDIGTDKESERLMFCFGHVL